MIRIKKLIKLLIAAGAVFLVFAGHDTVKADEYFTIQEYYVNVEVFENNTMEFEEIIYVDFSSSRHGIFREIPFRGFMTRYVDGEELKTKYNAKISDIYVEGWKYETSISGTYKVIKIGDADKLVSGRQEYRIRYTMDFGDDGIPDFDEFYFNLIGNEWDTTIEKAYMTVTMPANFDQSKVGVSSGYKGVEGSNILEFHVINGHVIFMETTKMLHPFQGVTMRIELPEGYFVNERVPYDWTGVFYIAVIALFGLIAFLWLRLGKDDKIYPAPEFYPPEDLTPAEIGYIVDATVDSKDIVSLIIYWADKGYIKIEERAKRDFYLLKLKPLPDEAEYYEHIMFSGLFQKRSIIQIADLLTVFSGKKTTKQFEEELSQKAEVLSYVRVKDLQNIFYITISAVRKIIMDKYRKKNGSRIFMAKSIAAKVITYILFTLPIFFGSLVIKMPEAIDIEGLAIGALFLCGFVILIFVSTDVMVRRWHSSKKGVKVFKTMLVAIIMFGLYMGALAIVIPSPEKFVVGFLVVTVSFAMGIMGLFMHKRTPEMNKLQEKILGLKMFLEAAEKDRINMLVNDNPEYFYNILPYAYVLGITDKWAKQFEHIALEPPSWYSSHVPIAYFSASAFESSLSRGFNSMTRNMTSAPSSSGSGGGGGSSGGGGGGGGGGSW